MSDTLHIVAASGASQTVDVSVADVWDITLTAGCTLSLTGASIGVADTVALLLRQDGTGGRTVTWPGSVVWPAGTAPTLHAAAADVTLVTLTTVDGGSTWEGFAEPSDGATGATGATGAAGTNGTNGADGGAITIEYTFSTTTTDADPGNGNLRLSNATQNAAVTIRADLLDLNGADWTTILDTFDDSTNTVKGFIRLYKKSDPTKYLVFSVSALAAPTGYRNITVANAGSSSSSPFTNGDQLVLAFDRAGDQGSAASSPLTTKGDIYVYSTGDARLPVGTDTQSLKADSAQATGLRWATGAGELLYDFVVTGSDKASIDTDVDGAAALLSTAYNILEVFLYARTDEAVILSVLDLTFNNDSGANYDQERVRGRDATASAGRAAAAAKLQVLAPGSSALASVFGSTRLAIPNYAGTVGFKSGEIVNGVPDNSSSANLDVWAFGYRSTSAISRVKVVPDTGTQKLKVGTRLLIYGR